MFRTFKAVKPWELSLSYNVTSVHLYSEIAFEISSMKC